MAVLRTVYVWPPSGFPDRPWCDDPGADAFAKVSRAICDRYSEALVTLGLAHQVSSVRIFDRGRDSEGTMIRPPGDVPATSFVGQGRPQGFEVGHVALPAGFAGWALERQQGAILTAVHEVMTTMAAQRGIVNADRLAAAHRHVLEHGFGFGWDSPWTPAPQPRSQAARARAVPGLAARVRYRLTSDGFGLAVLEVGRSVDGAVTVIARTREHRTWTTDKSLQRSARTLSWTGQTQVSVLPWVTAFGQSGPPIALTADPATAGDAAGQQFVEGLPAVQRPPRRTVRQRAREVVVPARAQEALLTSKIVAERVALAELPGLDAAVVARLALDPSPSVRRVIAARPDTDPAVLRGLVGDPDRATREALMLNPAAPDDVVVLLVADPDRRVRWSVLDRSRHPAPVLLAMTGSADKDLRWMTAERIETPRS